MLGAISLTLFLFRFLDTETFKTCWDLTQCGCPLLVGEEISVRPTQLRKSADYVVFYHTWVWGFSTGCIPVICLRYLNTKAS